MVVMSKRWLSLAGVILFLAAVFSADFLFFYSRMPGSQAEPAEVSKSKSLIDKPLPHAKLLDIRGSKVDEQVIRKGKVILVFVTPDCDACVAETKFLQTLLEKRKDVAFYGLIPFGRPPESPDVVEKTFPFTVFYDEGNSFVGSMGIDRVPVKVFLEDGIIKKGWIGAALTDEARQSFVKWFDGLPLTTVSQNN
jgi:hypothetical protein